MSFAESQARLIEHTNATLATLGLQRLELDALELRGVQCGGGLIVTECSLKSAPVRTSAQSEVKIADCHFNGFADFELVSRNEELGLWLSKNTFVDRPAVRVASEGFVDMRGNRFYEGADLLVGKGDIALDGTDFRRPAVLTTLAEVARPKLVSVRATDLVNLTVDDLDLSECQFAGAHNLDQLKFNGASLFGEAPTGWRLGRWPVRLAHRRVIAEEAAWRARCGKWWSSQWPAPQHRSWLGGLDDLTPADIADIYRRLRKAREDQKDEPGAADFYYGEMEMRRHSEGTPRAEKMILGLYWALSGYGLRASRAFIALATLTLGLSLVMWRVGFAPIKGDLPGYWRSFTYSLGAAALHPPNRKLTTLAEGLAIGFRVIGPVLLGLILLSIRGRVRR